MQRARALVLLTTLALAGAAGVKLLRATPLTPSMPGAPVASAAATTTTVVPAAPSATAIDPNARLRRTYAIELAHRVTLTAKEAKQPNVVVARLKGKWEVAAISPTRARHAIRDASLTVLDESGGTIDAAIAARVASELARPFYVDVADDGRITEVQMEKSVGTMARSFAKSLLSATQLAIGKGDTWTTEQQDTTGVFVARYQRKANAIERTKVRYLKVATQAGLVPVDSIGKLATQGKTTYALDAAQTLLSAEGEESLAVDTGEGMPSIATSAKTSLRFLESSVDDGPTTASAPLESTKIASAESGPASESADEKLVAGASFESLFAELAVADDATRSRLRDRLAARMRLFAKDAALASKAIFDGARGQTADALLGALADVGSAESRKALSDVASGNSLPADLRGRAIAMLGLETKPDSATVETLSSLAGDPNRDVATTSALALGNAAQAIKGSDPAGYDRAVSKLFSMLEAAKGNDERAAALRALGNAGDPRVLPMAEEAMTSEDANLRDAAVLAVRFVEGPRADALIAAALARDPDTGVRVTALFSIGLRKVEPHLPRVILAARTDVAESVRLEALRVLANVMELPGVAAAVAEIAVSDASSEVRQTAASLKGGST